MGKFIKHVIILISLFISIFCSTYLYSASPNKRATKKESKPLITLSVSIIGLNPAEESAVLAGLSIKNAEKEKKLDVDRIETLHHLAAQEILLSLEALGYYHSQIISELISIKGGYLARYRVEIGPPTYIQSVSVQLQGEGQRHPVLLTLAENPPLIPGRILEHSVYEAYKQQLLSQALQLGFLNAIFEANELRINRHTHTAEVILVLNTRNQYRIGRVTFEDPPYPIQYLQRYIPFPLGAPYTTGALNQLQKNFAETDLFKQIRIEPQFEDACGDAIPLKLRLKPRPQNSYLGSFGFGTDVGLRGMAGWERRRQHYPGHKISTTIKASERFNQMNLRYIIPGSHPATDRLVFGVRLTQEKTRDKKESRRADCSITNIKKIGCTETIADINYLNEWYRELQGFPSEQSHFLMPSLRLIWSKITEKSPRQLGFQVNTTVKGASSAALSTASFIQGEIRCKWILPLGEASRVLMRSQIGAISTRNFEQIPTSLRYFAGGDQSVRGFGYQNLGPREQDQYGNWVNVGAPYLATGSLELERTLYKQFSAAAFIDTGNAMNSWSSHLYTGAGLGIRYATPLGPLRIDIARALIPGKIKPRIHITFGMDL